MPCYGNIPEGDEIVEHWADDERVTIINLLDDLGQPFSCTMWGDAGIVGSPVIIDDGAGNNTNNLGIYGWFAGISAYPVNIFLDHQMNVANIIEAEMNKAAINNLIQEMLDNITTVICDDEYACNNGATGDCTYINSGACDCDGHVLDCANECGGLAMFDECGNCDADVSNDCMQDCAGIWGGSQVDDKCDVCGGDNSTCTDCNGDVNGIAYTDGCGACVGGNTGNEACPTDCNGIDGGTAFINPCGLCVAQDDMSCVEGCNGIYENDGTELVVDQCGICGGEGPEENLDCEGNELGIGGEIIPSKSSISSIYPNPFNPLVNIEYSLITAGWVNISIYDLNGQMEAQLFSGHQSVGNHQITWNGSEMSSGIYIITIRSRDVLLSDQLILLK